MKNFSNVLGELLAANVISEEVAEKIRLHYSNKENNAPNRILVVFAVLGAILVGLGIILILAHNWDDLSRFTKTVFAFLPLVIGQFACGYTLSKKNDSVAWKEGSASFLFFAVGASIMLVAQIYNIHGKLSNFLLVWSLLNLPVIYLLRSSVVSLLYIAGITYYACEVGYWSHPQHSPYLFLLLISLALPHYFSLFKEEVKSNFITFHSWFISLAFIFVLGAFSQGTEELMPVAYMCLFGIYQLIWKSKHFEEQSLFGNAKLASGTVGTLILLLSLSFNSFWKDLERSEILLAGTQAFWICVLLASTAGLLFYRTCKNKPVSEINLIDTAFGVFIIAFVFGKMMPLLGIIIVNIFLFAVGIQTISRGARKNHLGILNLGLLIITAQITCRFFDVDMSFIARGILFVCVGAGFFLANYFMLKKRKAAEVKK